MDLDKVELTFIQKVKCFLEALKDSIAWIPVICVSYWTLCSTVAFFFASFKDNPPILHKVALSALVGLFFAVFSTLIVGGIYVGMKDFLQTFIPKVKYKYQHASVKYKEENLNRVDNIILEDK